MTFGQTLRSWPSAGIGAPGPDSIPFEDEVVGVALGGGLAESLNGALEEAAIQLRLVEARGASSGALARAKVILVGQGIAQSHHDLVASIRRHAPTAAVLLVAEPGDDFATVLGLELGADAFVRTDEGFRVLMSQVRAMLRQAARWRTVANDDNERSIQLGRTVLERDTSSVLINGAWHALPIPQFALLWAMASQPGRAIDRSHLAELAHAASGRSYLRQVDTVVCRLRRRLDQLQSGLRIRAVRRTGYLLSALS